MVGGAQQSYDLRRYEKKDEETVVRTKEQLDKDFKYLIYLYQFAIHHLQGSSDFSRKRYEELEKFVDKHPQYQTQLSKIDKIYNKNKMCTIL